MYNQQVFRVGPKGQFVHNVTRPARRRFHPQTLHRTHMSFPVLWIVRKRLGHMPFLHYSRFSAASY
jgi:hypothetical protein